MSRESRTSGRIESLAALGVALLALVFSTGGLAMAKPVTAKKGIEVLTTATGTITGGGTGWEGGELELADALFTQEAGAPVLLIAELRSPDLPAGCWAEVAFAANRDGIPVPDKSIQGLTITSAEWVNRSGANVLGLTPSTVDIDRAVQALQSHQCATAGPEFTVELKVAVVSLR
jgi:hypothetical protein